MTENPQYLALVQKKEFSFLATVFGILIKTIGMDE